MTLAQHHPNPQLRVMDSRSWLNISALAPASDAGKRRHALFPSSPVPLPYVVPLVEGSLLLRQRSRRLQRPFVTPLLLLRPLLATLWLKSVEGLFPRAWLFWRRAFFAFFPFSSRVVLRCYATSFYAVGEGVLGRVEMEMEC